MNKSISAAECVICGCVGYPDFSRPAEKHLVSGAFIYMPPARMGPDEEPRWLCDGCSEATGLGYRKYGPNLEKAPLDPSRFTAADLSGGGGRGFVAYFGDDSVTAPYRLRGWARSAIDGKTFRRRPRIAWTFGRPGGQPWEKMTIAPVYTLTDVYRAECAAGGYPEQADEWPSTSNFQYDEHRGVTLRFILPVEDQQYVLMGRIDSQYCQCEVRVQGSAAIAVYAARWIRGILDNPAEYACIGSNHCSFCGRGLTDPVSRELGYGPDCAAGYRLPHGSNRLPGSPLHSRSCGQLMVPEQTSMPEADTRG